MKSESNVVTREELIAQGCTEKWTHKGTAYYEDVEGGIVAKVCKKCNEIAVLGGFCKNKKGLGGRESACKACDHKYREVNLDRERERSRKWNEHNAENRALIQQRRRAREASLTDTLTLKQWTNVVRRFGGVCALTGSTEYVQEHALPIAIGHGGTAVENMSPMRADLNKSKNDRHIFEWFEASHERFNLSQRKFDALIEYLAEVNEMSTKEYRMYVDWCHDNPRSIEDIEKGGRQYVG